MTQDEIIEMAQECGLVGMRPHLDGIYIESLLAFAKLVADKALADHAIQEVQRLGQEIEPDDIASILACRDMLDAQPVSEVDRVIWPERTDQEPVAWEQFYATPPQRKPLTFAGQSISEIRLANGLTARFVKDILIVEFD